MAKMFFNSENCEGATSGSTGNKYMADKQGFINVTNPADIATLKSGGYILAGGMPKFKTYYVCDVDGWEASINHCPRCDSSDLRKVES